MILKAKNISKTFGTTRVLSGISLTLQAGESLAITGRSGEGKTTLLHILGSLEKPDSGEIEIASHLLNSNTQDYIRREQIGFVFQSYNLLEDFTALENVSFPLLLRGKGRKEALAKAYETLREVFLEEKALVRPSQLSGGEQLNAMRFRCLFLPFSTRIRGQTEVALSLDAPPNIVLSATPPPNRWPCAWLLATTGLIW